MKLLKQIKLTTILFIFAALSAHTVQAQIEVFSNGNIGIDDNPGNTYKVRLYTDEAPSAIYVHNDYEGGLQKRGLYLSTNSKGTGSRYGIYNSSYSTGTNTHRGFYNYCNVKTTGQFSGIYNYVNNYTDDNKPRYGIFSYFGGTNYMNSAPVYGIYSRIQGGGSGHFAGYFEGDVHIDGTLTQTSDARKKENIRALPSVLNLISSIDPKSYTYKDKTEQPVQFGFLAQEVEKSFPELVKEVTAPVIPQHAEEGEKAPQHGKETFKSVNYVGMIPVLLKAIQEQQELIAELQTEVQALKQSK